MKKILMSKEFFETPMGQFFHECGVECIFDLSSYQIEDIDHVVNDYFPELINLSRLSIDDFKLISGLESNIEALIYTKFLNNSYYCDVLKFCLDRNNDLDILSFATSESSNVFEIKIQDYLNIGYFIDSVAISAYQQGINPNRIRNYLNELFDFNYSLISKDKVELTFNLSFSFNENVFIIQLSFREPGFQNLKINSNQIDKCYSLTNVFTQTYSMKRSNVTFSALWFKNEELKESHVLFKENYGLGNKNLKEGRSVTLNLEHNQFNQFDPARDIESSLEPVSSVKSLMENIAKNENILSNIDNYYRTVKSTNLDPYTDNVIELISKPDFKEKNEWVKNQDSLIKDVGEEVLRIKSSQKHVVESDYVRIISKSSEVEEEKITNLVGNFLTDVITEKIAAKIEKTSISPESIEESKKLKRQLSLMKDVVDKLKLEIVRLRSLKVENLNAENVNPELIEELNDKLDILQMEKENVQSRLNLAERNLASASSQFQTQITDIVSRKDREIESLKTTIQNTQNSIERLKAEKIEVENKLIAKAKSELEFNNPIDLDFSKLGEGNKEEVVALTAEKKALEDKLKLAILELKKADQKIKFANAQVVEAQRKNAGPMASASKTTDSYIKQLDAATARLSLAATEIADRKKENFKLKQESSQMALKIAELEKKLAHAVKKAS